MAEAVDEAQNHHVVPACLLEPPPSRLYLQPSWSDESVLSMSGDEGVTMTTSSGAIVTTATTQSRRHSSAVPFQVVTPSRRQSMYDTIHPHIPSSNIDRVQSLTQQVLALHVTVKCHEEQTKQWQINSTNALELQLEKQEKCEQAILDNQQTIQQLREKITQHEHLCKQDTNSSYPRISVPVQVLTLAAIAIGCFTLGKYS